MSQHKTKELIQWHPAFSASLRIELKDEAEKLSFTEEHMLGNKPMQIDVLIIKKKPKVRIEKNIGRIFKTHNIIEYKSPDDNFSVNDFYKVYGYACFYQADTDHVLEISPQELTITIVCSQYPAKMVEHIRMFRGVEVVEQEPGIYYLMGDELTIQLLVPKQLSPEDNLWLSSLGKNIKAGPKLDVLLEEYRNHRGMKDYHAVMDAIVRANKEEMEAVKMCDAIRELFADELDEAVEEAVEKAVEKATKDTEELVTKEVTREVTRETEKRMARKLLLTGNTVEDILKITEHLSFDEVRQLQQE